MSTQEQRFAGWLEIVGDLMTLPMAYFPWSTISRELAATFQCRTSWNWVNADGGYGFELVDAPPNWPEAAEQEVWREAILQHPLVRWYALTGDPTAMSIARVPRHLVDPRGYELVREHLRPVELEQQLSVPYRIGPFGHRTFVLARGGEDFSREDLLLARRIQPLLALLARQVQVLETSRTQVARAGESTLSGRELAVLALLSEGLTAVAIGHRLALSPRTVHKHLERIYRKLQVTDRLLAVRTAQERGLVPSRRTTAPVTAPHP